LPQIESKIDPVKRIIQKYETSDNSLKSGSPKVAEFQHSMTADKTNLLQAQEFFGLRK